MPRTRSPQVASSYPPGTYRVSQIAAELRQFLGEVYGTVWVVGEMHRMVTSSRGHLYFELVEKGAGDEIVGRLDGVLFRRHLEQVRRRLRRSGQELAEGVELRCCGRIDFFVPRGRLQLVVRDVDPVFSLGLIAQRRQEVLDSLAQRGLMERNRRLVMPALPLRLGLVTSEGSAAYHDFLSSLRESGYPFRVVLVHASVQGASAPRQLVRAMGSLGRARVDCAVLVRGGGARSDLAAFDTDVVAEAIARAPFPVVTGLGHETDRSIADLVAHRAFKTPTMAAEFLVGRVARAEGRLYELERALSRAALLPLERSRRRWEMSAGRLGRAGERVAVLGRRLEELRSRAGVAVRLALGVHGQRLDQVAAGLRRAAPRRLAACRPLGEALARSISELARARVREESTRIRTLERLTAELGPQRILERGFSITRREDGSVLRDAARASAGERLTTDLAKGRVTSRVLGS